MKRTFILFALFPLIMGSCQQDETAVAYNDLNSDAAVHALRFETVGGILEKESKSTRSNLTESSNDIDVAENPLIICEFGIGRPKHQCRGFGICEFKLFPKQNITKAEYDKFTQYGGVVETDINGQKYLKVLVSEDVDENLKPSLPALKIDDDFGSTDMNDVDDGLYTLKRGDYNFDASLGEHGGYKINIK